MTARIAVIGGGLAGAEAAWQIATLAGPAATVDLFEMRPAVSTPAHKTSLLAELVCSNSLKSESPDSPAGLLKQELADCGSLIIRAAVANRVPAGKALAVDREAFAKAVTEALEGRGSIKIIRKELERIPDGYDHVIVATGPLTSPAMAKTLAELAGGESLYFYDAIAPIVEAASVDMSIAFFQDRYAPPGSGDYLNLPMDRREYETFVETLLAAEKTPFREFEKEYYFEGCLPIEEIAARGKESLAFGPLKPVGLTNPATGRRPYAAVQLRKEDAAGYSYNLVGFQTKLKIREQERVFRSIPGLADAIFLRHGSLHRNTYLDSPKVLDGTLRLTAAPSVRLAGQMTGVEGYLESAACGALAGIFTAGEILGMPVQPPPGATALGALLGHLGRAPVGARFQPANMTFALFPPPDNPAREKKERRRRTLHNAREEMRNWRTCHRALFSGRTDLSPGMR